MEEKKFTITGEDIDKICENRQVKYMFLVSLISSDNIRTIEDAEKSLSYIDSFEKALKDATISPEEKTEIESYLKRGKGILNNDIERFKKEK